MVMMMILKSKHVKGDAFKVNQFHFTSWPKNHEPNFLRYLTFHRRVMEQHDHAKGPILVHCRYVYSTGLVIFNLHTLNDNHKHSLLYQDIHYDFCIRNYYYYTRHCVKCQLCIVCL